MATIRGATVLSCSGLVIVPRDDVHRSHRERDSYIFLKVHDGVRLINFVRNLGDGKTAASGSDRLPGAQGELVTLTTLSGTRSEHDQLPEQSDRPFFPTDDNHNDCCLLPAVFLGAKAGIWYSYVAIVTWSRPSRTQSVFQLM